MGSEGVGQLRKKCFWKTGYTLETQLNAAAFGRHVHFPKQVIPQAQRNTVIDAVGTFRQIFGVVPQVRLGTIKNILQRP